MIDILDGDSKYSIVGIVMYIFMYFFIELKVWVGSAPIATMGQSMPLRHMVATDRSPTQSSHRQPDLNSQPSEPSIPIE